MEEEKKKIYQHMIKARGFVLGDLDNIERATTKCLEYFRFEDKENLKNKLEELRQAHIDLGNSLQAFTKVTNSFEDKDA